MRNCLAVPLLVILAASVIYAATGTILIIVRDADTHYAVHATIKLEGPKSLSAQTDNTGSLRLSLAPGEYRMEISAPAHKVTRTHYNITSGANLPFTIMLDPDNAPEEERPEAVAAKIRPGFTLLHGYTVDGESGKPLSGVKVRFVNAGVEAQTDSKGHYLLSVPTPPPANPGGMGTDTLIYEKAGYKTITIRNFGIATEEMGGIAIDLQKGKGVVEMDGTHKLMRDESDESRN